MHVGVLRWPSHQLERCKLLFNSICLQLIVCVYVCLTDPRMQISRGWSRVLCDGGHPCTPAAV